MSDQQPFDSSDNFTPQLGLFDCLIISLGGMVGSAIFVFPGTTGQLTGPAAIGAWSLAGVLMLAISLCYTELALAFPTTGALAIFPYETLGPYPTIRAFASYLEGVGYSVGWVFGITISALAIADYLAVLFPAVSGHSVLVALIAIGLATLVNLLGINVASRTNLVLSAVLLAILVVFIAAGLARFQPRFYDPFSTGGAIGFFAAVQVALTGYGAWTAIPATIEEVKHPTRTVPRAILLSLAIATLLYTSVIAALHGIVAPSRFVEGSVVITAPLRVATAMIGFGWLRVLLTVGAVLAIFTTLLVGIMSAGRVLFALGLIGTLPAVFETTSTRSSVPWVGILTVAGVAGILATVPRYFFQLLVVAAVVGTGLPYAINILSFVGLRYYRTDVTRPFRAPGGYALPAAAFAALGIAMVGLSVTEIVWSVGMLALLSGYFGVRIALGSDTLSWGEDEDEAENNLD